MPKQWWLAIDFGTSNTAAAGYEPGSGAPQVVSLSHSSDIMSSSVYADSYRNIVVGDAAVNQATNNPAAFITHPKRHIGAGTIPVGNLDLPLENLIAAVLNSALSRASERREGTRPSRLILTHPVAWSPEEIDVLTRAAELIGFNRAAITLISEPRAAIAHYTRATGDEGRENSTIQSSPGQTIAVVDYGGGTCDVAVVKISSGGKNFGRGGPIDLIAHDGNNGLGGRNLDALIRRWVDKQLTSRAPELLEYLRTANLSTKRVLDNNIRRAKELLSESPRAAINISAGGHDAILELTRGEFEQLIAQNVDSVVELTTRTLARAGAAKDVQIYLTGGSSRVPLVHQRLGELGTVARLDNPKTVVALGALEAIAGQDAAVVGPPAGPVPRPGPGPVPVPPPPPVIAGPQPPQRPQSPRATPPPAAQHPNGPLWGPPNPPPPPPGGGYGQQSHYAAEPQPKYAAAAGSPPNPPGSNRKRNLAIAAIAAVVVLAVAGILGVAIASSGDDDKKADPGSSSESSTTTMQSTTTSKSTERTEPTTETSTSNVALDDADHGLVDANPDLLKSDTCDAVDRPDYAIAGIICEPTSSVIEEGSTGAPPTAIGLFDVGTSDVKEIAEKEHTASNTSQLYNRAIDGEMVYSYFDTFDDNSVAYIVYSVKNGTITWWMTDSTDQAAFTSWLRSSRICIC